MCMLFIGACDKKRAIPKNSDYLMFGHFFGECAGESCVDIFRLEQERLLEDTRDKYPHRDAFYQGFYVEHSSKHFEAAKDLKDFFPTDLLLEGKHVIGEPDAGDWGGLYIEYNFSGTHQFWLLDLNKNNVPAKYHAFIDKVEEKIALLQ